MANTLYSLNREVREAREYMLRKLYQIFQDGYRPARGRESYNVMLDNGLPAYDQVNCFGHIFNLRNQQFNDYQFLPERRYGRFPRAPWDDNRAWANKMLDFIREVGLRVTECDPTRPLNDFKSWKIALYFSAKDFHYLLEDTPQNWSSKYGFSNYLGHINRPRAPHKYRHCIITPNQQTDTYYLHGTYQITNPHADENNRYVKDLARDLY